MRHLRMLGERCIEEHIDEHAGYSMDAFLPEFNLAVEVDGPSHFARGSKVQLGHAAMKHRHLRQLGYALISIPYWEWDTLATSDAKVRYLSNLASPHIGVQRPSA